MPLAPLLRRLTGRAGGWPVLPTAEYYLLAGIGDLVSTDGKATAERPIVRTGPNTWARDDRLVIVRYVSEPELAALGRRRWRSVHYVIDDLIPAAEASTELPADYRDRLARFARTLLPRVLDLGPAIVAPSRRILDLFPGLAGHLLDPGCLALARDGTLPAPTPWRDGPRLAFLGTRSHIGSMPLLAEIAARLETGLPAARLHLFLGRHLPEEMTRRRNVVNAAPIAWPDFPSFCRANPFHVGLAPVQDTPFARARSITKVMDHAAVGAVGIYACREPFLGAVTDGGDGRLVADDAEAWCAAIAELARRPADAERLAAAGADLARRRGAVEPIRRFWMDALDIAPRPRAAASSSPHRPSH